MVSPLFTVIDEEFVVLGFGGEQYLLSKADPIVSIDGHLTALWTADARHADIDRLLEARALLSPKEATDATS